MEMKKCSKCGEVKAVGEFYKRKNKPYNPCKACVIKRSAEWGRNNRDKQNQYKKNWKERNPGKVKKQQESYKDRRNYLMRIKWATDDEYRKKHTKRCIDWQKRNREKCYERTKEWKKRNNERYKELELKYRAKYKKKIIQRRKKQCNQLHDSYVKALICRNELSFNDISNKLLEIKRQQIKHLRLIKQLKSMTDE